MKHTSRAASLRFWLLVWGLGIVGQLCWNMENQWFNTFVYAKIAKDPTIISWMVAISAIATTAATFLFGTLSDRCGKRKIFTAVGYILWGLFTILFGMTEYITGGRPNSTAQLLFFAAAAVVLADALMSFFGSMGNDASFNAWLNDMMTDENRGHIGAALATQPIIGTIIGTVAGGLLIGSNDNYMRLFVVMGGLVILFGVLALTAMEDSPALHPNRQGSFFRQLFSAFDLRALLARRELVWVFLVLMVYFIAFNVYYPHVGNYMIYYLGFDPGSIGIIQGIALILGMGSVIPASRLLKKNRFVTAAALAVLLSFVGVGVLGVFVRPARIDPNTLWNPALLVGLFFFGCGYVDRLALYRKPHHQAKRRDPRRQRLYGLSAYARAVSRVYAVDPCHLRAALLCRARTQKAPCRGLIAIAHRGKRSAARTGRRIVSFPKGAQAGILHAEREVPGAEQTEARVCGRSCKRKEEKREERHAWRMPLFRGKDIPFAPAKELSDSQILTPGSESGSGRQNRGRTTWWPWRASHPRSWPCPWT